MSVDPSDPPGRPRWWFASMAVLMTVGPAAREGVEDPPQAKKPPAQAEYSPPISLQDPRLAPIRLAAGSWAAREGPKRAVVDQVCLVPDLPTFLEAIATWDEGHYFPILIDDVESTLRFLRAFRPARVVRLPKAAAAIPPGQVWARAVAAVGASWARGDLPGPPGDVAPSTLGPTPPGLVFSNPDAPMLAGAVALAAGRFQPLLRFDHPKRFNDNLTLDEFRALDRDLTAQVAAIAPRGFSGLGDQVDFLTIAGDWSYRYRGELSEDSVDDGLGRLAGSGQRWAFAGRLLGDPALSVYRAMCALFLRPESALMFNSYGESGSPWADYSMRVAASRMSRIMPTSHVAARSASIEGWHEAFDPINRFGLVLINTTGGPNLFTLEGGPGMTPDVPRTIPAAVYTIHSYSAADPTNPATIAGRWLANGAYVYFGSTNEPYLQSFRPPRLVGDILAEGLPMVVAARATLAEPFGKPWRLAYLGDPLFRIGPAEKPVPRVSAWEPTARWPTYAESARPTAPEMLLPWALKATLARQQAGKSGDVDDVADALLGLDRRRLDAALRPIYDALLADVLSQARRRGVLRERIAAIPRAERSADLRRWYDTILAMDFQLARTRKDFGRAKATWVDLMRVDVPGDYKKVATERVTPLADTPVRRQDWSNLLRSMLREHPDGPEAAMISAELKRVNDLLKSDPK